MPVRGWPIAFITDLFSRMITGWKVAGTLAASGRVYEGILNRITDTRARLSCLALVGQFR